MYRKGARGGDHKVGVDHNSAPTYCLNYLSYNSKYFAVPHRTVSMTAVFKMSTPPFFLIEKLTPHSSSLPLHVANYILQPSLQHDNYNF